MIRVVASSGWEVGIKIGGDGIGGRWTLKNGGRLDWWEVDSQKMVGGWLHKQVGG